MNKSKINSLILALAVTAVSSFGMAACNTGTEPGETNVERGEIRDEGEMVGEEGDQDTRYEEGDSLERYYDDADHENHEDNTGEAIGDGAYDGKGDGVERDEVN